MGGGHHKDKRVDNKDFRQEKAIKAYLWAFDRQVIDFLIDLYE